MSPERNRKQAVAFGAFGETLGAVFLMLKGYRILERRYRRPVGEIDIIARRKGVLAFIEVKARVTAGDAAQAISAHQRARIQRAAGVYMQERPDLAGLDIRFDALLVIRYHFPIHIVDAWRPWD